MQGEKVPILWVDTVAGKAAAQAVGPVVHGLHALGDLSAVHPLSAFGDDRGDGAPRGDADLALSLLHGSHSFLSVILR